MNLDCVRQMWLLVPGPRQRDCRIEIALPMREALRLHLWVAAHESIARA